LSIRIDQQEEEQLATAHLERLLLNGGIAMEDYRKALENRGQVHLRGITLEQFIKILDQDLIQAESEIHNLPKESASLKELEDRIVQLKKLLAEVNAIAARKEDLER
jgi:hypothetical protein